MFGHLKAEDFMNLMDGTPLDERKALHAKACSRCAEQLRSVQAIRGQVSTMAAFEDEYVPEPEWLEFRDGVRNSLLSRSVKRDRTRTWILGSSWKPAAAWGVSMLLVLSVSAGLMLQNQTPAPSAVGVTILEPVASTEAMATMSQTDVFDDLIKLDARETAALKTLLEAATSKGAKIQ